MRNRLSNLSGNIIGFNDFLMFLVSVSGKKDPSRFWWKQLKQYTHWNLVETIVWRIIIFVAL